MLTLLVFDDVPDARAWMELPSMRLGDRLTLRFQLERRRSGRAEALDVRGEFRVASASVDGSRRVPCRVYHLTSMGVAPAWRSIKNPPTRRLGPCRFPKTSVPDWSSR